MQSGAPTDDGSRADGATPLLSVSGVSKRFGAVEALKQVSLQAYAGEVLAICGENGAGKSTLMKVLMGIHQPDSGHIEIDGRQMQIANPRMGQSRGIALVSQELSLAPDLSVEDNIWLGSVRVPFLHRTSELRRRAAEALAALGFDADAVLSRPVGELSIAERQLVEIARNLCRDARVLLLDEPTATLSDSDIERLFQAIAGLRAKGCAVMYITHRIAEVLQICDRATVLRNGEVVGTEPTSRLDRSRLVEMMIGQRLGDVYQHEKRSAPAAAEPLLSVRNLVVPGSVSGISFDVYPGQIVGIAGQIGSGAAEVVRAIAGLVPAARGRLSLKGREQAIRSRAAMREAGIAFISEDRAAEGLFLRRPIRENLVAASLAELCTAGYLSPSRLDGRAAAVAAEVGVDAARLAQPAGVLSGGNQQKLAFGRCLAPQGDRVPSLILMNEPTRGVDIGARAELYKIMRGLCRRNFGLLMHTTDLEEMLGLADVILTMYRGRLVKIYPGDRATLATLITDITHSEAGTAVLEATP